VGPSAGPVLALVRIEARRGFPAPECEVSPEYTGVPNVAKCV